MSCREKICLLSTKGFQYESLNIEDLDRSPVLSPAAFIIFWLLNALLNLAIVGVTSYEIGRRYLIYLTDLSYLVVTLYFLTGCQLGYERWVLGLPEGKRAISLTQYRWYYVARYYLFEHAFIFSVIVTSLYWVLVFPVEPATNWSNFFIHGAQTVQMVLEFSVNSVQFVPCHVIVCCTASFCYSLWTIFYWGITGDWIYEALQDIITWPMALIAILLIYAGAVGLDRLKWKYVYPNHVFSTRGDLTGSNLMDIAASYSSFSSPPPQALNQSLVAGAHNV
eukprot:TRINITY_DN4721_c0_g1::TRINITY_DN4721_c0_g1_i1::g.21356::m.21356 TRINITY_DN4721_c0_g1::TRINITY_DN4721_c0_g1_i1::g.21356  ORF type:complete len:287 (+),score=56.42 TRINITY_DN4721_c0_g1_i1:25-861(+)